MSSAISLDKITQAITEIENCRAYDTPDMKPAKENWLEILCNARDRYESLEEKDIINLNNITNSSLLLIIFSMLIASNSLRYS